MNCWSSRSQFPRPQHNTFFVCALSIFTWPNAMDDDWLDSSNDGDFILLKRTVILHTHTGLVQLISFSSPATAYTTMLFSAIGAGNRFKWQSEGISVVDFVIFILWYLIGLHGRIKESKRNEAVDVKRIAAAAPEPTMHWLHQFKRANMKNAHVTFGIGCSHRTIQWLHVIMKFTFCSRHCRDWDAIHTHTHTPSTEQPDYRYIELDLILIMLIKS